MTHPISRFVVRSLSILALSVGAFAGGASAIADDLTMSFNAEVIAVPVPGSVTIDGKTDDWDLSAGIWSYNSPTVVEKYSLWTHMMWDDKGVYMLGRYHDVSPLQNAARGKDFQQSWRADAFQARVILDDQQPDEHQMHINMFYSTQEQTPYIIVKHGGFKAKPPYDATGPDRPDQLEQYGADMLAKGGKIAFQKWDDGKGYNMEVFWPWSYLRTSGKPLNVGESFTFSIEAMWGNSDGSRIAHRLADGIKDLQVNRIFMFRARSGWGKVVLSDKGNLKVSEEQRALQAARLKRFVNYDTTGSIAIGYELPEARDVTIAIDNSDGVRVRNLFGQFPRPAGAVKDLWDGLDDAGNPVPAGSYKATIVDHKPIEVKLYNSLYNAATPPWVTEAGAKLWGANHGHPTSVASRGDVLLLAFTGTEGGSGIMRVDPAGKIIWVDANEFLDVTNDDGFAYGISRSSWQKKTLLQRFRLADGQIMPFDDEAKSPAIAVRDSEEGVPVSTSIASAEGKLFVFMPGLEMVIMDPKTGAVESRFPVPELAAVSERDEKLYGLTQKGEVVRLDARGKQTQVLFTAAGVKAPARLGIRHDAQQFAISDSATNQVFVVDAAGKPVVTIGAAYAGDYRPAGKFDSDSFSRPLGLDFDAAGKLWVAEANKSSKRITRWSAEGKLEEQFWGAADYGAMAGFALTKDSTKFIAHAVEFELDPKPDPLNHKTNERPLIFHPELKDQRGFVYSVNGIDYACGSPGYNKSERIVIAKRGADGVFRQCVRVDLAGSRTVNKKTEVIPGRAWVDLNADGAESADEITNNVNIRGMYWSNGWVRPDLTIAAINGVTFPCKGFTKDGVPIYDFANPVPLPNPLAANDTKGTGSTPIMDNAGNVSTGVAYHMVDGRRGRYPNPYGRHNAPAAQRGLLIAPFRTNGVVEDVPGVGSITAIGGDRGEWFLISMDGLYISSILQDAKGEVTLDETYVGQESFGGLMWRDEKGRVLAQLGGPSYRLVEILGLDTVRKQQINLNVTAELVAEGQRLAAAAAGASGAEATEIVIARVEKLPNAAASPELGSKESLITNVPEVRVQEAGNPARWWRAALAHDGKTLAISYQVADPSPWKNAAGGFTHAFIGGDCVDLKLDVPGRGAIRLLSAPVGGKNTAVYFQKTSDKKDNPTTYSVGNNVANASTLDIVRRSAGAKVTNQVGMSGYTVLVTIPLAELGLDPATMKELKGVVGVIYSDPSGTNRVARLYWSDKQTDLVSDVPSESRLDATRWGRITLTP